MAQIVIDARELRTSTGRYVERLLHYLQQIDREHKYTVLLTPKDFTGWHPVNPNFTKMVCPYKEFTFAEQLGFLKQVRSLKADLVHFTVPQQPILYRGRVVTTIHDLTTTRFKNPAKNPLVFTIKQQTYKWVVKRVAKKSATVIAPSEFVKTDIVKFAGISPDKITVTYEAADKITAPAAPLKNLSGKAFLLYIGRPTPHKNLKRLLGAMKILKEKHPGLVLVLAGKTDKNYERLRDFARKKSLTNLRHLLRQGYEGQEGFGGQASQVFFTNYVGEGQLRWLYENTAAYVFPSLSEGFGLPGLEAMAHGAPVVASNATCLPEIYGSAAHYFNPLDVNDMANKIDEVLSDDKLRSKLITNGHDRAKKYSWRRMATQTLEIYHEALKN